jgi:integrase
MGGDGRMGRPPLPLGTYGSVKTSPYGRSFRARTLYRDFDGVTRRVERHGPTRGSAERTLREALRDRVHVASYQELGPDSRVSVLAEAWYATFAEQDKSPSTLQTYRDRLDRQIIPGLGELRVRELTVGTIDRFLRAVVDARGAGTAKLCRSVLSGMCGLAARHDLLDRNPVRDAGTITRKRKRVPRALSLADARQLRALLTYDDKAISRDLLDFADMMLATGQRIGETAAVVWDALDLDAATVEIRGTVIRIKGKGLVIKPAPKSEAGYRTLVLPSWCVAMLTRRRDARGGNRDDPVFPAVMGGLRDPSNTQADLREAFDLAGYDWLTSHTFRKTVATLMDEAGLSARAAADQLGHANPSLTQDAYYGRKIRDTGAAAVLEPLA